MMHSMSRRPSTRGFTLLEVMVAVMLLAVGSVSVLAMLGGAIRSANARQAQQRLAQVLEEARFDAQTRVNAFQATDGKKIPGNDQGIVERRQSDVFAGYSYELKFTPVNVELLESGFEARISVKWGGDAEEYVDYAIVQADTIPPAEFAASTTFELERKGLDKRESGSTEK